VFAESTPFLHTYVVHIPITYTFDSLSLILESDPMSQRNLIVEVLEFSSSAKIDWEHDLHHRTIIKIDDTQVLLISDVHHYLAKVDVTTRPSIGFIVADHKPTPMAHDAPVDDDEEPREETYNPDTWTPSVHRVFGPRPKKGREYSHLHGTFMHHTMSQY
jgi:hypothetical protein